MYFAFDEPEAPPCRRARGSEWRSKAGKLLAAHDESAGGQPTNSVVLIKGN